MSDSHSQKTQANQLFAASSYKEAIEGYNNALSTCPNYLEFEIAVLKSNIAACHLKLEDWKEAVVAATAALEGLDKLQGVTKETGEAKDGGELHPVEEEADEEIVSAGAAKAEDTSEAARKKDGVDRIRAKALMRRAKARSELGGWSALQGAEEGACVCEWGDLWR